MGILSNCGLGDEIQIKEWLEQHTICHNIRFYIHRKGQKWIVDALNQQIYDQFYENGYHRVLYCEYIQDDFLRYTSRSKLSIQEMTYIWHWLEKNTSNIPLVRIINPNDDWTFKLTNELFEWGYIDGSFQCNECNLFGLDNGPKWVLGDFNCSGNKLWSLRDLPTRVGGTLNAQGNVNLDHVGCKKSTYIGESLLLGSCPKLTTLERCPSYIGGDFFCYGTQKLKNTFGLPRQVGGDAKLGYQFMTLALESIKNKKDGANKNNSLIQKVGGVVTIDHEYANYVYGQDFRNLYTIDEEGKCWIVKH